MAFHTRGIDDSFLEEQVECKKDYGKDYSASLVVVFV